ncbi:Na+/H+ antiporter subunit E [Umezakia ovalisporum]|jgi:multicomponent Na+:H+ antiporter subunit E|uniref:Na+/H+ antiporter subunit E n=1 Tax=Umezakia ovalisporum FSS-43 TaxID=2740520 RepID=A0ABT6K7H2_9CYAN|nr:Na+/H+ antiporter subunit E [Umezakia ovalisporum]MBI1240372.1 cation:proton antiporter [Nostoc sp. RI_552]MDH6058208.1 Na+/H+ antiporter subunit E [Umezakia ovalisporum FSS-43]MDH6069214.1 Na+/H+ antiporter subunit E [Umezakia ovalisporum APH033B]MDH6072321.1 Na+/H+ antiporter subunit E [Umezakia ovalisporum CobakiLakeA]MDH6076271.1 Na+/H+ antiporter subunit E [Umezakia ovalisporum CS-1034]
MIGHLNLILRLAIWFLLTSDVSLANIIIGITVAILLPGRQKVPEALKDWLRVLGEVIVAIPQAYVEALEIIFRPHQHEDVIREQVKPQRTPGLIFLDIFLITFTPKTIVLKYHQQGWYEVHRIRRRKKG